MVVVAAGEVQAVDGGVGAFAFETYPDFVAADVAPSATESDENRLSVPWRTSSLPEMEGVRIRSGSCSARRRSGARTTWFTALVHVGLPTGPV